MDVLDVYLQQHWAASAGGVDLATRVARTHAGSAVGAELDALARAVAEDREALRVLMVMLDRDPSGIAPVVVRLAERIGRLKPNGRVLRRSPVSDVLELEAWLAAVSGTLAGWEALLVLGPELAPVPDGEVRRLRDRADDQLARLAAVHRDVARRCLVAGS